MSLFFRNLQRTLPGFYSIEHGICHLWIFLSGSLKVFFFCQIKGVALEGPISVLRRSDRCENGSTRGSQEAQTGLNAFRKIKCRVDSRRRELFSNQMNSKCNMSPASVFSHDRGVLPATVARIFCSWQLYSSDLWVIMGESTNERINGLVDLYMDGRVDGRTDRFDSILVDSVESKHTHIDGTSQHSNGIETSRSAGNCPLASGLAVFLSVCPRVCRASVILSIPSMPRDSRALRPAAVVVVVSTKRVPSVDIYKAFASNSQISLPDNNCFQ